MFVKNEDAEKIYEEFLKKDWGDGLPIIPPNEQRVKRMLEFTDRKPDDSLGKIPPMDGEATVEKVAVNAVMAGCKPEYFPVVLTAVECALDPRVNLPACGGGSLGLVFLVNGPIVKEIGLNYTWNILGVGPAFRANVTIARAPNLCILNIGGLIEWVNRNGSPMHRGVCFAENEDASPYESLQVDRGFDKDVSTVTVMNSGGERSLGITGHGVHLPTKQELEDIARYLRPSTRVLATPAYPPDCILAFSPWHLWQFYNDGWSKSDIQRFLFERARANVLEFPWFSWVLKEHRDACLSALAKWQRLDAYTAFESPDNLLIISAGAENSYWTNFAFQSGRGSAVTKPIALADGTPVKSVYDFKRKR